MSNLARQFARKKFEGYIQVVQIKNGKVIKLENFTEKNIEEIKKYMDKKSDDIYYTPNTSYNGKRGANNLKNLRAFYLDFDFHNENLSEDELMNRINNIIGEVWMIAYWGKSPEPRRVIHTGRGIHIYWEIEPSSYGAISSWQEFEDYLYNLFKHLGADRQATDSSRLMRLWNTINLKTKTECRVLVEEDNIWSCYDLRDKYLNWQSRHNKKYDNKKNSKKGKLTYAYNSYTLHLGRARDIKKLVKMRKGKVTGYRNFIIHCYAYWKGIYVRDKKQLKELVYELNESFTEPLRENEIDKVLKSIDKAIDKFLDYEQGVRAGKIKKVTKGMRDKGGYWYKNETLIERLDITEKEQEQLETIIGTSEKYKIKNHKRTPRNENGLTKREQQKQDTIKNIQELKIKGLKQSEVAEKINKSIRTVKLYWNL